MGDLLSFMLPREHTSLRRSMVICFVAGILAITIQAAATLIPNVIAGTVGEWLELTVLLAGGLLYVIPMGSAVIALMCRLGYINTQEWSLNSMLLRDYLNGLWPHRGRGKD
jgi:hypothetical protein